MTECNQPNEVALIVGGGPGISASWARLFTDHGMRVDVAARNMDKPVLEELEDARHPHDRQCPPNLNADIARSATG